MNRLARGLMALILAAAATTGYSRERLIEQLTVAVPSDTPGAAVDGFLVASEADRVVFTTAARDLLPIGDRRGTLDRIYRFDGQTGKVSAIPIRAEAEGEGVAVAVDPTGRWLLVESSRRIDLVAGGSVSNSAGVFEVALFLVDMDTGATDLVTRHQDRANEPAPQHLPSNSQDAFISADGRFVLYSSPARSLDPNHSTGNGQFLLYRFDRQTGLNRRVGFVDDPQHFGYPTRAIWADRLGSRSMFTAAGLGIGVIDHSTNSVMRVTGNSHEFLAVSDNGAYLLSCSLFQSPDGRQQHTQWRTTSVPDGETTTFNAPPPNMEPGGTCAVTGSISNDGRVVSVSEAIPMTDGINTFSNYHVVQWHLPSLQRVLISRRHDINDAPASGVAYLADADATGSRLVIASNANNLVAGQSGLKTLSTFVWDRSTNRVTMAATHPDSPLTARSTSFGKLGGSGSTIYFRAKSSLLPVTDTNRVEDLFVHNLSRGTNTLVTRRQSELRRSPNRGSFLPKLSRDGERLAYKSAADDVRANLPELAETDSQVYSTRLDGQAPTLVSARRGNPDLPASGPSTPIGMSTNGRFLAFESFARDLDVPTEFSSAGTAAETFVRDFETNTTKLITRDPAGSAWSGKATGRAVAMGDDGAWVLYSTDAPSPLLNGYEPGAESSRYALLWLPTDAGPSPKLATHAHGQPNRGPDSDVEELAFDPDLLWVAYRSAARNLVPNSPSFSTDQIFASNRLDGRTVWLTRSAINPALPASGQWTNWSKAAFSADGAYFVMTHSAGDLAPPLETQHDTSDCFRATMATGQVSRVVSVGDANRSRTCFGISANGRYVVYGDATDLQVWRADMQTGAQVLVSVSGSGQAANDSAYDAQISADGSQVLFVTSASNLDDAATEVTSPNLFLRDLDTGTTTLVTNGPSAGADPAGGYLLSTVATPDFRRIVFAEESSALRPDIVDAGNVSDLFLSSATRFTGNPGLSGLWGEPGLEGQGFHLVNLPAPDGAPSGSMLLSWYTYQPNGAAGTRTRQRWLLGLGTLENGVGTFTLSSADDGLFDDGAAGTQVPRGTVTLRFTDCNRAEAQYRVTVDGQIRSGLIPLSRITPDTVCSAYAAEGEAALVNLPSPGSSRWQYGMGGAWHDAARPGQGFLVEVLPQTRQVIATWFTFDAGQSSGGGRQPPAWYAAIGPIEGNHARLQVFESAGGRLDELGGTNLSPVGTIDMEAVDCARATAQYVLMVNGASRSGNIPLDRITSASGCRGIIP